MKLTIIRLKKLSSQDRIDLAKIWPEVDLDNLENTLDEHRQLYVAKFNDRLLAAVEATLKGTYGELNNFRVREVTRRRGVGSYLLEETLAQNAAITQWWVVDTGSKDREAIAVFMQKGGFVAQPGGWASLQR